MKENKKQNISNRHFVWIVAILLMMLIVNVNGQGYQLKFQVKGIEDTVCYLANYYGDKTYLTDTASEPSSKFQ